MNVDVIPLRVFAGWAAFGVAAVTATVLLWTTTSGLFPVVVAFCLLRIFHPPVEQFTDAELHAWLSRG